MTRPTNTPGEAKADRGTLGRVMDALWPVLGGDQTSADLWHEINDAVSEALRTPAPAEASALADEQQALLDYHHHQATTYIALGDAIKPEQRSSLNYHIRELYEAGTTSTNALRRTSTDELVEMDWTRLFLEAKRVWRTSNRSGRLMVANAEAGELLRDRILSALKHQGGQR